MIGSTRRHVSRRRPAWLIEQHERSARRCCRPRQLGPEVWEGKIPRVIERECSAIVAASLVPDPDGTWPTMEELARRLADAPRPALRVSLPVWR